MGAPKEGEIADQKKLHHDLHLPSKSVRVFKSKRLKWEEHVAHGKKINVCRFGNKTCREVDSREDQELNGE
jgi:hypothetical protein